VILYILAIAIEHMHSVKGHTSLTNNQRAALQDVVMSQQPIASAEEHIRSETGSGPKAAES